MRDDSTCNTRHTTNQSLLPVAEVIIWLRWLELVVQDRVDRVSHEEIAQPAPEMCVESLEDSAQAGTGLMDLPQNLERIVSLLLN